MARMSVVGKTATHIGLDNGKQFVQYHATKVISWDENEIVLNSGGWHTATTKTRINQASRQFNLGISVYQKNFDWFVCLPDGSEIAFEDNMKVRR